MTAKEKAKELVNTMLDKLYDNGSLSFKRILHARAVECAKVLVDEILTFIEDADPQSLSYELIGYRDYWRQVKQEIENI